ncbi:MAG: Rrf2 family transcriptional regulator, partial [Parvibaculaceae bacterium]|nr:Rrf2 family transcriptional regulator [Parvibaculaceae bacterium]
QLFARLRRANLVTSVRGPGGGYLLSHLPDETRISDIIIAVDEPLQATRCKPGSASGCLSDHSRCLTHDLWDELSRQIHLFLNSVSLGDVIEGRLRQKPNFLDEATPGTTSDHDEASASEVASAPVPELHTTTG